MSAGVASAATPNGTLEIRDSSAATALSAGKATDPFTAYPTTGAPPACTNDGPNGYQQFGYMIPKGDAIVGEQYNTVAKNFTSGPTTYGFLLQTAGLANYGPEAPGSAGVLNGSPVLQFSPSNATTDLGLSSANPTAVWEVGVGCYDSNTATNPNGANALANQVIDDWNCEVTFTLDSTVAGGYTWTDNCGSNAALPEVPLAVGLPIGAAAIFGGAVFLNRRRRTTPIAA